MPVSRNEQNAAPPIPQAGGKKSKPSGDHDTMTPRYPDTTVSRHHSNLIEVVRKAVKEFGKEAATHRFTLQEKKDIADIIHIYRQQGVRTSENELARIAVNFLISDYRQHGQNSILHRVIEALNM